MSNIEIKDVLLVSTLKSMPANPVALGDLARICDETFGGCNIHLAADIETAEKEISLKIEFQIIVVAYKVGECVTTDFIETARDKFPDAHIIAYSTVKAHEKIMLDAGCDEWTGPHKIETALCSAPGRLCGLFK